MEKRIAANPFEDWSNKSENRRRLYAQEGLILEVTESIWDVLKDRGWQKQDLARALGCSKSHVTQLLNGGRNMTLRTLADIAETLNCQVSIDLEERNDEGGWTSLNSVTLKGARRHPISSVGKIASNRKWVSVKAAA